MFALFLLSACLYASVFSGPAHQYALEEAEFHFEAFIKEYNKQYADHHEKAARFEIFKMNLEMINRLNEENVHAVYGINEFMDITFEEFQKTRTGLLGDDKDYLCEKVLKDDDIPDANAPDSFDWRDHGAVTRVKDQDMCGCCYAFSAIGNIEGQYFLKHGKLEEFSEQQIVDCDQRDHACGGGFMSVAMDELAKQGGCALESAYKYLDGKGKCQLKNKQLVAKVTGCVSYDLKSQEKLKQLLYKNGPIAIGIRAQGIVFYEKGIVTNKQCLGGSLDHAVLLVGYGEENDVKYWIVKNSWGILNFGEDGYFRMERSEEKDGACGMMNPYMASAVVA